MERTPDLYFPRTQTVKMGRYAAIDVGTNTALLLVADLEGSSLRTVLDRATFTRLGKGVGSSRHLAPDAVQATLAALEEYAALAKEAGAIGIAAMGTAVLREARDGVAFVAEAAKRMGVPLKIVSGEEEARLAALAVARAFPDHSGPRVVCDIGGGSTELLLEQDEKPLAQGSYPVGSVKLTEKYIRSDPPAPGELASLMDAARQAFASLPFAPPQWTLPQDLVGTAGTVTTLCAIHGGISPYDPEKIHGAVLSAAAVQTIFQDLAKMSLEERRKVPGLSAERADVILAGAAIFLAVLERLEANAMAVCHHGTRHGLLWDCFGTGSGTLSAREIREK
jgi:exopolyphosphatase/guanosine-5'-triphosphate,3'-diphosphate pyrophosphatase